MIPFFEFEVAIQDFLHGNDVISRIGVVNSHPLKVTVGFEDEIWVVCSQEGVETETSYGLTSLLPELIRNYITTALERNEGEDGVNNIGEGLTQRVVGYLTFLPRVCVFCGNHRLLEDSLTSTCSNICEARKNICRDSLPLTWASDRQLNMEATQQGLSTLLLTDDDGGGNENAEDLFDDDDDDGNENAEDTFN
ncbi:hypothetical protein SUGI_0976270 [Cryptomeria japonica]|nr:hypothetical protein SUGI_0976270 [Cryptomeria japonica]